MSIFSKADTGLTVPHTFFNLSHKVVADCSIGKLIPLSAEFGMPGDVWKLSNQLFIRTQAMLAPMLTDLNCRMRYFFVPLRLLDSNTELIITGSKDGHFDKDVLIPSFKKMFDDATDNNVVKYSVLDYMLGMPIGDYSNIKTQNCMPAQYWLTAYEKVWWDWYRDENLSTFSDYSIHISNQVVKPGKRMPIASNWRKDYFTSSLPFQQKGPVPTIDFSIYNPSTGTTIFDVDVADPYVKLDNKTLGSLNLQVLADTGDIRGYVTQGEQGFNIGSDPFIKTNLGASVDLASVGSNLSATDIRILMQTQRIFERLARTGSRLNEYYLATFGTSPRDDTLQRTQYLGGFTQPIIVSEVLQSAQDSVDGDQTPVGTLRGKGVSLSSNTLETFFCKEFGVILGILEIMPKATYTQGINRKFTMTNRFDFVNPSFENLSEQEIRNGEVYIDFNSTETIDGETVPNQNDETFGFTEMYNELKINQDRVCGDMRDNQSYWTMARYFSSRPNLNDTFIRTIGDDFSGPFAVTDMPPIIVECGNNHKVWRPLKRYSTPGLVDHN